MRYEDEERTWRLAGEVKEATYRQNVEAGNIRRAKLRCGCIFETRLHESSCGMENSAGFGIPVRYPDKWMLKAVFPAGEPPP
jgi:hypothetical protein